MDEVVALFLFFLGISMTTNVFFWISSRRHQRRIRELENRDLGNPMISDERIERVERAMEALGLQVDQLSTGQEFLNRLIAERAMKGVQPILGQTDRPVTPH